MVDTKDILRKAAEDVQSGMWCQGRWFADHQGEWNEAADEHQGHTFKVYERLSVEAMQNSARCAEGSLILATRLLGGTVDDYDDAVDAVLYQARREGRTVSHSGRAPIYLFDINDDLPEGDPFEAGQQLAELFRQTADSL